MKKFLFIFGLFALVSSVKGQNIEWSRSVKLSWNDFKGSPDNDNSFLALTRSGFSLKYKYDRDSLTVETQCTFKPESSWVKKQTDALLTHEQLHFDITEYYRRLFLSRILAASINSLNAKDVITRIQTQTVQEMHEEQSKYDEETNHSINKEEQEKWNKKYLQKLNESFERKNIRVQFTK